MTKPSSDAKEYALYTFAAMLFCGVIALIGWMLGVAPLSWLFSAFSLALYGIASALAGFSQGVSVTSDSMRAGADVALRSQSLDNGDDTRLMEQVIKLVAAQAKRPMDALPMTTWNGQQKEFPPINGE